MIAHTLNLDLSLTRLLRTPLELVINYVQKMNMINPKKSEKIKPSDDQVIDMVETPSFDLLVIDDGEFWRKVMIEAQLNRYRCDTASTFQEAVKKIQTHKYRAICLSQPFHTINEWRKLLIMLKSHFSAIPIIMISNDPPEDIRYVKYRYPNIKQIIFKGDESDGLDFVSAFDKTLHNLIS